MKYWFIDQHRSHMGAEDVPVLCVSRSGITDGRDSLRARGRRTMRKYDGDKRSHKTVTGIWESGSPKITGNEQSVDNRVARLMKKNGIAQGSKKF